MSNVPGWVTRKYLIPWGDRNWKFIYHEHGYSSHSAFVDAGQHFDQQVNEHGEVVGKDKILWDAPRWYLRVDSAIAHCDKVIRDTLWAKYSLHRWIDGREMLNGDKAKKLDMTLGQFNVNVRVGKYVVWRWMVDNNS